MNNDYSSIMWIAFGAFAFYLFGLCKRPLLYIGFSLQTIYLGLRGINLERLPLVGPHDTLAFLSASIIAFSIPISYFIKNHPQILSGAATISVIFTAFSLISRQHNTPLPPVLKIIWFELHVVLAFLSYALFAIAAVTGILYLKKEDNQLEGMQYKSILLGYCFFSLSMIFGGIWAYLAWGTYWLWTPKELWTTILWIFYSLYLHARLRQWWMGRPAAILGTAGFGVVLFTYLGVSLLMKSSHTF